jgi:chromate transporter
VAGGAAAATVGPWLVLVLLLCGGIELGVRRLPLAPGKFAALGAPLMLAGSSTASGGLLALVWVALKVGALSYGGGFVIVPLMQADAVSHYHWMTNGQFLSAVALGQITPGPVVQTVAAVGYAQGGVAAGLLASAVAFSPSFAFILIGGGAFDRIRRQQAPRAFLGGAGPAALGAILGSAIPLARALSEPWQFALLGAAAVSLLLLRRGVVVTLLGAASVGVVVAIAGGTLPR